MTHRIGECSACGAQYKLPASFTANRAKCKKCGGVVEIGASAAAEPEEAAPPVPASRPAGPQPVEVKKKKREGPSMKERLLAERQAAAAGKKAAKPVRKSTAKVVEEGLEEEPASKSSRRSSRTASSRGGSRRGGASSRKRGAREEEDGHESGSRRGSYSSRRPPKKAPVVPFLVATLLFALGGWGIWYVLNRPAEDDAPKAPEPEVVEEQAAELTEEELAALALEQEAAIAAAAEEEAKDAEIEAEKAKAAAAARAAKKEVRGDPDSIDLTLIMDFEAIEGCDEDRFIQLRQWAAEMVDPDAGAAGNRAKMKLIKAGKEAFPAILNALKRLDLTDVDGDFRSADVCQKALEEICNGMNYGWYYPSGDPDKYHYEDKKIIRAWCNAWDRARVDEAVWLRLSKQEAKEKTEEEVDASDDELDEIDDL